MASPKVKAEAKAPSSPSPDATSREPVGLSPSDIQATSSNTAKVIPQAIKAAELVFLAAVYSPVSQLTLSPVYGSIPPSLHHRHLIMAAVLLAWTLKKTFLHKYLPKNSADYLPLLAFCIPTIQFFLFQHSGWLGATHGPLVTELLTYFPLVVLSVYSAAVLMDSVDISQFDQRIQNAGPGIASYALFSIAQRASTFLIRYKMGSSLLFTRWGLQSGIAAFYAVLLPSKVLLFAILPMLHSASLNPHAPLNQTTGVLNAILHEQNYALLARQESLTGYLSVLENTKDGFRVMRCDHSLLGGEWLQQPNVPSARVTEPIYSVFAMLEAVRLVETAASKEMPMVPDNQKNALVMYESLLVVCSRKSAKNGGHSGLGIGTTPSALVAHGIDTTIVEIDPVVHDFATRYFHLPSNHTSVIGDAMYFVGKALVAGPEHYSYDYVIHDVFTGGAEPPDLFTEGFLAGLRDLLKPDGVVAIVCGTGGSRRMSSAG